MTTTLLPAPLDLEDLLEVNAERLNRKVLVQQPGIKVLHVTLAPGQALPPHRHPGDYVLLQALSGIVTVQLEQQKITLFPQHLLGFPGERLVSLRSSGDAPSAVLITLVKQLNERKDHEDPSHP